jgi:Tol biopolymer transport system component
VYVLRNLRRATAASVMVLATAASTAATASAAGGITLGSTRLYAVGDHNTVVSVTATGATSPLVALPHHGFNAIVSPDGRWVSYRRDNGVYAIRSDGTGNRRLAFGHAQPLAWAPDSRSVLLVVEGRPLTIVHVSNGAARALDKGDDWDVYSATFSPDGRYVLVSDLYGWRLLHTSTGAQRTFLKAPCANTMHLAWSPDGRRIAMACDNGLHPGLPVIVLTVSNGRVVHIGDNGTYQPIWVSSTSLLTEQFGARAATEQLRTYDIHGRVTGTQTLSTSVGLIIPP